MIEINPDRAWYFAESERRSLTPRCPFATVYRCPRYFQSLSLLGSAGCTEMDQALADRLYFAWRAQGLWPPVDEQATSISTRDRGSGSTPWMYDHFCPEVLGDSLGFYADYLCKNNDDEIDQAAILRHLQEEGYPRDHFRHQYQSAYALHYAECQLYSVLRHQPPDLSGLLERYGTTDLRLLLRGFARFERQLRSDRRSRDRAGIDIADEYDVQDLLHSSLKLFYDDVRPEEPTPSTAGASTRVDFLLAEVRTVVEVKRSSPSHRDKQIGEELVQDIFRYRTHPACDRLFCLVYDGGSHLRNPAALERDLTGVHNGLAVEVIVSPKSGGT